MNPGLNTVRLLGAVQLFVFAAGLLSEQMLKSVIGSGSISDILVNVSKKTSLMRASNFIALLNCLAILTLGVLFYVVLHDQNKTMALVALGCFFAEGVTLAVSKMGASSLIPLSHNFAAAGFPESSHYQSQGNFLYHGVDRRGYDIHMLFFCVGAVLWYIMLYTSKILPPFISLWGVAATCLLLVPVLMTLLERDIPLVMILGLPYAPFELVLGIWLIIKSFN